MPAVSGGSAVEHALKLSLLAQSPKSFIVALKGGFGGKTLLALSGTSKPSYKKGLDPLYPDVLYVDPFAPDAVRRLRQIVETVPVAVIQLELVQGVGGVREIPQDLLEYLQIARRETGVLLFVDEIQTGMFRTGPFVRSSELSICPDLMTLGKGTSDMMFPFAMTLYSDRVNYLLKSRNSVLPSRLHGFPLLMGFCQYEPHILKFTPPLTTTKDEVEKITRTISDALRSSTLSLLTTGIRALLRGRK